MYKRVTRRVTRKRKCHVGERFGRLLVLCDGIDNNQNKRTMDCLCDCGTHKNVALIHLTNGNTTSCGCFQKENMSKIKKTHGDSRGCRLFRCWRGMRCRSAERGDSCNVYHQWQESYENFRDWSLANGYTDDLILCRNGDVGDYEPDNCRWDTQQSNNEENLSKHYKIKNPNGELVEIYNIRKFGRDNGLDPSALLRVINGINSHHKNWTKWEEK
ncbi:hypothetical protein VPDG_00035 [Vibrio phage henriette 12B8]|uniref:HNH endonuclease n=1 Tax=Vibrio phage henriette 12B8 TaxID=573174 RepID=UPI0002C0C0D2|nr:HNH endonuclease [Vibrio phage henriette 12B8]AGG58196.1 hypothetical protein VPDG_00035 [Vibrio phage henriette 12B8]